MIRLQLLLTTLIYSPKRLKKEVIYHMVNHISTIRVQPICFHLGPRENTKKN